MKNNIKQNLLYLLLCTVILSCKTSNKIGQNNNTSFKNLTLIGEWNVDIPTSQKKNKEIKISKIKFDSNPEIAKNIIDELSELNTVNLANLGIINADLLSPLEGGTMLQVPSECIKNFKGKAPDIPFVFIESSSDSLLIFKIPTEEKFMSVNLTLRSNFLELELNPATNLTLFKNIQSNSILNSELTKNDLKFNNLKGRVKSITTLSYDSNERAQNDNGELKKEDIQRFSKDGDIVSNKSILHYYNSKEFKTIYMGRFGDRRLIKSSDTTSQILEGDTLKTYTKRGVSNTFYKGNCKHYSNPIGIKTITYYDYKNDRIIEITENPEGKFQTVSSIDKKDEFGNWLILTSYESFRCSWKKKQVKVREIEYYE